MQEPFRSSWGRRLCDYAVKRKGAGRGCVTGWIGKFYQQSMICNALEQGSSPNLGVGPAGDLNAVRRQAGANFADRIKDANQVVCRMSDVMNHRAVLAARDQLSGLQILLFRKNFGHDWRILGTGGLVALHSRHRRYWQTTRSQTSPSHRPSPEGRSPRRDLNYGRSAASKSPVRQTRAHVVRATINRIDINVTGWTGRSAQ